ncbi:PAAR motif-containing protein [Caballeronia temeraria]|uniref:PAAR motif-containing protein n=1 Tax=Caballeronia temeraria TaxID=1777137 RepID=A0A158APH8_9BURK|nr:PAAR domain-containing protein [Caballeronia temeraria]SAK59712.1 PAAR motif-containing protein [Caballeronia temeraria]
MSSIACEGDRTTHGGHIITGSDTMDIKGRGMARRGDLVTCPEHGTNPIIECSDMLMDANGEGVALDGHLTACGSRICAYEDHGSVE